MHLATSNALALMFGYSFYENFGSRDLIWLVIGVVLAIGGCFYIRGGGGVGLDTCVSSEPVRQVAAGLGLELAA